MPHYPFSFSGTGYVAETYASCDVSASCYGRAKDILVEPMVVPKLKFSHV